MMDTKTIGLVVLAGVFLVLYLLRRRSRLGREDD
jgi:hypothetical protein